MTERLSFIDSHAHLDYPQFADQLDDVVARAVTQGVDEIITIGVKLSTSDAPRKIADTYSNVWFSAGIHPHEAKNEADACNLEAILAAADHPRCVAIGEAGLDYFYETAPREMQADSFRVQIEAARRTGMPIVVHSRDADDDMAALLEEEMAKGAFTGVMHCFSSGSELARRALDIGFYLSFSGILTFSKSDELRAIAATTPTDRILVETDSPYLAPVPHRGKTNEPAHTHHVLTKLADVHNMTSHQMAAQTKQNTYNLFTKMRSSQ
jgi:TatD DNase family protein